MKSSLLWRSVLWSCTSKNIWAACEGWSTILREFLGPNWPLAWTLSGSTHSASLLNHYIAWTLKEQQSLIRIVKIQNQVEGNAAKWIVHVEMIGMTHLGCRKIVIHLVRMLVIYKSLSVIEVSCVVIHPSLFLLAFCKCFHREFVLTISLSPITNGQKSTQNC